MDATSLAKSEGKTMWNETAFLTDLSHLHSHEIRLCKEARRKIIQGKQIPEGERERREGESERAFIL